ncbi:hypothetical protein ABT324_08575 [Saccharopolyspora sp. NPDC000359]|uniref:hypothetical protein n=1 Tax=Saccharopolyspora sp. NPDC000359 TaxID=3154251 RepID=UPI00332EDBC8
MRKTNRLAALIPGGLLAAALIVSGCATPAEQPAAAAGAAALRTNEVAKTVDVAMELEFTEEGGGWTLSYVEGRWVDSGMGAPHAVIGDGPTLTATLAPGAQLLSPFAGGAPTAGPQLDEEGLGVVPISVADFAEQHPQSAKIWFDKSGQITKIAARYQP